MLSRTSSSLTNLGLKLSRVLASSTAAQEVKMSLPMQAQPQQQNLQFIRNTSHAAVSGHNKRPPWYILKKEEHFLRPPTSSGDEDGYTFESSHPSQKFANVLSQLRSQYPPEVWSTISNLYPNRKGTTRPPLAVDIAVGGVEGRGAVELARRGFHVVGIESDAQSLARTFQYAQQHNTHIELMTTKVEKSLVHDDSADLVTFFHGLHLVDTSAALQEAWRMLKPGAKLIAAWNDRDLSSPFMKELEDIMELHISNYNRHQKQRAVDIWSERLTEGALFRLIEYAVHPNPIKMHSPTSLLDILDCLSFVRANLQGPNRKSFNKDVRTLLERRFDHHSFDLPLETKIYVLEKVSEEERRSGNKKYQHHLGGGKKRKLK